MRVWDLATGDEFRRLRDHDDWFTTIALSLDGRRIVSGSLDKPVRVWDAETGQELHCLRGHEDSVRHVGASFDSRRGVSNSDNRTLRMWDVESGNEFRRLLEPLGVTCVTACKRRLIVFACAFLSDTNLQVFDIETGEGLHCLRGHKGRVNSIAISADDRWIISGSSDETRVWNMESGECLRIIDGFDCANAIAVGFVALRFQALHDDQETRIVSARTRTAVAWFAEPLSDITIHSSGLRWVGGPGTVGNHLYILQLEGGIV